MPELLEVDRPADSVARLTLRRPDKRNALSVQLRDEMSDALDELRTDESVHSVVITGAGDVFCAGFDLREFENPDATFQERLWASSERWHLTLLEFPLPLVAAVNGPALAGGFDLAVMCDIRIAADTARFAHPEFAWAETVYTPLHDLVGGAIARDLCLTGRAVDADEALRMHLVSRVVPRDQLDAAVAEVTGAMASANRDNLRKTKLRIIGRAGTVVGGRLNV